MTRFEAESELIALEVSEAAAWSDYVSIDKRLIEVLNKLEQERTVIREQFEAKKTVARERWIPLQRRKNQLRAFLEMK